MLLLLKHGEFFLDITFIVMLFCSAVCSCLNNCFEQSEVVRSQSSDELDHESSITLDCVGASTSDKKNEFGILAVSTANQ